jgi:hypothetical protein
MAKEIKAGPFLTLPYLFSEFATPTIKMLRR